MRFAAATHTTRVTTARRNATLGLCRSQALQTHITAIHPAYGMGTLLADVGYVQYGMVCMPPCHYIVDNSLDVSSMRVIDNSIHSYARLQLSTADRISRTLIKMLSTSPAPRQLTEGRTAPRRATMALWVDRRLSTAEVMDSGTDRLYAQVGMVWYGTFRFTMR